MRRLIGLGIGMVAGGILGHFQFFCPGGTCPLTSTWLGGTIIGGLLGMLLVGGCPACDSSTCRPSETPADPEGKTS
jgi:hypothetical protein